MSRKFLLCFHDFSVWNFRTSLLVIDSLKQLVGGCFSILVIPWTEGASEDDVAEFKQALLQLKTEGFELALHGLKHKAEFSQGRSYAGLVGMNMTSGEAEFAGLSEYESSRLLHAAIKEWHSLLADADGNCDDPVAFVPPTWFSNKYLPRQVLAEKMLYEDRFSMTTAEGTRYPSPVVSFAGIPKSLDKATVLYAEGILKFPFGIPRIAVHPVDFPRLNGVIRDLVRLALGCKRELTLYKNL